MDTTLLPHPVRNGDYRPFPNVDRRNVTQGTIEIPLMIRALKPPEGRRMLEVGCGIGNALEPLARLCRPCRLVGVDIDRSLLAVAARTVNLAGVAVELYEADVRRLPFADGSFDVVIDFGTCYHISDPERAVREIARVLATGGCFIYETPLNQLLSHPVRSHGRRVPWSATGRLTRDRAAIFWGRRRKVP